MHKLIAFIRSTYVVVLFVAIEACAIYQYATSTAYTRARLLTRVSQAAGGLQGGWIGIQRYFRLERENRELTAYAADLQQRLSEYAMIVKGLDTLVPPPVDSLMHTLSDMQFRTMTASVVGNSINRAENYILLNRGWQDGVTEEMAVLSPGGAMVGYVVGCTERYAVALSVLSRSFRASGRLRGSEYFGSVYWDGRDPHRVVLDDLSKYADPQPGDEVVTTGFSHFFPEEIKIGEVVEVGMDETRTNYTVRVELAARLSGLSKVILVENRDAYELNELREQKSKPTNP